MKFITLLTDFGLRDEYVAVMKGVIWNISPDVQIADISHSIRPQNVLAGAILLGRAAPYFPSGTVHIAVVDPGVGTERRPIAACLGDHFFVGPDNGIFTILFEHARNKHESFKLVHLNQPRYWLPDISSVFHGRDIFAPVGAHLVNGVPLSAVGTQINDPMILSIPNPLPLESGWQGQIIYIDHFGNLVTNILRRHLQGMFSVEIRFCDHTIIGLVKTFGAGQSGQLIGLIDSANSLNLCVVNGNAAEKFLAKVGDPVVVIPIPDQ